jgi:hypothetical protein
MGKQQPNSQLLQPNAPVLPKKERDAKTEQRNQMEDVICINN